MKLKLQIKNRFTGSVLFECEKESNTIKDTVLEAIKSRADLSGANLSGANLSGAELSYADLSGANLYGAKLYGADLSGANLSGANLSGAELSGANLSGAELSGAEIKIAAVFTGLYKYVVIAYATTEDKPMIKMGCYNRSLEEWEADFWNNPNEFPNNGDDASKFRLMAFETAKKWIEIVTKK